MAAPPSHSNLHKRASREKPCGITPQGCEELAVTLPGVSLAALAQPPGLNSCTAPRCDANVKMPSYFCAAPKAVLVVAQK
jgi:hypothetical protein